jgi:hypothetical protein
VLDKEFDSPSVLNVVKTWSHDQKTRRPTTKGYFHSEAARNEAARKT